MASSAQMRRLMRRPADLMRFQTTGRLPQGLRPEGPLVDLMRALGPGGLAQLRGVTVDARLGYRGSRQFAWGAQAYGWIAPAEEVFDAFPADSWRDPRFARRLYLEDLLACCASYPSDMTRRFARLCRPQGPSHPVDPADSDSGGAKD